MTGAERLLAACRGEPVDATPVWFMRQAGGSLPRYLALRERYDVVEIARTPELCAEVSAGAADALGTDGAVMFADIMLPVMAMGVEVALTPEGPVIERPIRERADLSRLRAVEPVEDLAFVLEAVGLTRAALGERAAVIGIAGGPFTLAAYLVEGRPSRGQLAARRLAFNEPSLWSALLDRLTDVTVAYVRAQVEAGAQVVQVFDSWAGSLTPPDYDTLVAPWAGRIMRAIRAAGAPAVHFVANGGHLVERLAAGADVVAIGHTQSIAETRLRAPGRAIQGNLDPARLGAPLDILVDGVRDVLADAAGLPGHIFNTGHAVPRDTDPARLRDMVDLVHDLSQMPAVADPSTGRQEALA
jgi:uroporphyrinogen decarboxylase